MSTFNQQYYHDLGYQYSHQANDEDRDEYLLTLSKNNDHLQTQAKVFECDGFKYLAVHHDYFDLNFSYENLLLHLSFWENSNLINGCDFISLHSDKSNVEIAASVSTLNYVKLDVSYGPFLHHFYDADFSNYIKVLHQRIHLIGSFIRDSKEITGTIKKQHPSFDYSVERGFNNLNFYGFTSSSKVELKHDFISFSIEELEGEVLYNGNKVSLEDFLHSSVKKIIVKKQIDNLYDPPKILFNRFCNMMKINEKHRDYIYHTLRLSLTDLEVENKFALLVENLKATHSYKTFTFQIQKSPTIRIIPILDFVFVFEFDQNGFLTSKEHYPILDLDAVVSRYKNKMITYLDNELDDFSNFYK